MQSGPYADAQFIRYVRESCPARARLLFLNVALLRNIQTVQELLQRQLNRPPLQQMWSLTFRISLFRTLQICWMSAADCETFSSEFPNSCSSSFWFFEGSTSTPGCITTLRTIFSPMKFLCSPSALRPLLPAQIHLQMQTYRISTSNRPVSLFFSTFTLMGKCA